MKKGIICVDFDGTIVDIDFGNKMFNKFSINPDITGKYVERYREGEISLPELYQWELFLLKCREVKDCEEKLFEFSNSVSYDESFITFVKKYAKYYDIVILSDGFEWYIRNILRKMELESLQVLANIMLFEEKSISIKFPYSDETCKQCGNCKRNHVRRYKEKYNNVIYIGDGISDYCACKEADLIYAKKDSFLHKMLEKDKFDFTVFSKFSEVKL